MKKLIMFLCCVIFGLQVCHAQYTTEKYTVAVADFTGNYADEMFNACLATMPICRVTVVNWNDVAETDLADNVDFIVTGNIGEITSEPKTGKQILTGTEYTYYSCKVNFTLVMTDANTGTVVATRTSFYTNTDQDPDKAISDCLKFSDQDLRRLVDNGCIIKVPIPTIQEVKKNKAQTAIIDAGPNIGICEGLYFDIQVESEISGRTFYKTIGAAKVKEVLSDELTLCEITKGGKDVMTYFSEGNTLILKSKEEPLIHF